MFAEGMKILAVLLAGIWPLAGAVGVEDKPRAARSVHLGYDAPEAVEFLSGMIVEKSVPGTFFMACGWDTGYFGMQELGDRRKVVIFSVWDPTRGDDPDAVPADERVKCLFQAPDVRIKRFGGEGTGAQCMADLDWKIGGEVKFFVRADADGDFTTYTGCVKAPGEAWRRLVAFRVRTGGRWLRGLHSFLEDFRRDTRSAIESRRASFGGGWARTVDGEWVALRNAKFTASNSEWEAKESIDAGRTGERFHLATGGETVPSMPLGSVIEAGR